MIETEVESVSVSFPPTVAPDSSASKAARHLRHPEVPALVVRNEGEIVGIVTESDIVAMVAETEDQVPIGTIMSKPVMTIDPTATLPEAAEMMRTTGVKHLPIVSDGGYQGLLSARSLSTYLSRRNLEIEWTDEPLEIGSVEGEGTELQAGE